MKAILLFFYLLLITFYGSNLVELFEEELLRYLIKMCDKDLLRIRKHRKYLLYLIGIIAIIKPNPILLGLIAFVYKQFYFSLLSQEKKIKDSIHYAFPIWIRSIQCLLQSHTVVSAIRESYDDAPLVLKDELLSLVERLEHRPEDLSSYTLFMSNYENLEILKMMKHLYRYSRSGSSDSADAMYRMVDYASEWMADVRRKKQSSLVSSYSWLGIVPVAAVSIFFVLIMFFVIVQMFEGGWML